jgi:hypothetical protein
MASFTATPSNWTNSSDANFRAWGSYISARLAAVGLVQTADTGQINWVTVLTPAGINTYQGYEIWRFDDALQATFPVYIKIQYGEDDAADGPGIRITFGSGSNGTGSLTGNLSTDYDAACPTVAGACVVVGSGSSGRFCMNGGFTAAGGFGMWFGFERSKDQNGDDTSEAVLFCSHPSASNTAGGAVVTAVWSTTLGVLGATETSFGCLFPAGATMAAGTQTMVAPVYHSKGVFMNPGLNFAGYFTENITPDGTPTVYMYGLPHVYYALEANSAAATSAFRSQGTGTEALMLRYE